MPSRNINRSAQRVLEQADGQERFVDLQLEFRGHPTKSSFPNRLLGSVGGRWDRVERRYLTPAELEGQPACRARVIWLMDGQRETVEYWFGWLRAYITGDWDTFEGRFGPRQFAVWTVGGRRRGKSFIGVALLAAFCIAIPGCSPWMVAPTEDEFLEGEELPRYWRTHLPPSWYEWQQRDLYVQLVNGSRVLLKSAHDGAKLKAGSVDYCLFNEPQKVAQLGYDNVMGGLADTGSMCHIAANPPRDPKGFWVQDLVEQIHRGNLRAKLFDYRHENPFVVEEALDALRGQMSEREYAIEREGRFMARPNIVLHEFEDGARGHVRPTPSMGDITAEFLQKRFGVKGAIAIVGMDFQRTPFQVATIKRLFLDPDDPEDAISWTVGEVYVPQGDEDDLVDALEAVDSKGGPGLRGDQVVVVADGTGDYQQSDRARGRMTGRGSWDMLRARGWKHIFTPAPWIQRNNPLIEERVLVGNARLRGADGRKHAFIDPRCVRTVDDLRKWPNDARGRANKYSPHAHMGDAWTYVEFRLWPRRFKSKEGPRFELVNVHGRDDRAW